MAIHSIASSIMQHILPCLLLGVAQVAQVYILNILWDSMNIHDAWLDETVARWELRPWDWDVDLVLILIIHEVMAL